MKILQYNSRLRNLVIATSLLVIELSIALPAKAHHPLGGRLPDNFWSGIMSGFGHPIIGYDHLAFVIASGLIDRALEIDPEFLGEDAHEHDKSVVSFAIVESGEVNLEKLNK